MFVWNALYTWNKIEHHLVMEALVPIMILSKLQKYLSCQHGLQQNKKEKGSSENSLNLQRKMQNIQTAILKHLFATHVI